MTQRILLCVLDWGLGHATRSLALVKQLEKKGHEVLIASSGRSLDLLKIELPHHQCVELPGYDVQYDSNSFEAGILTQLPKIFKAIRHEREVVEEIVASEKIDGIISDNRYGCYSDTTRNIFLSHHLIIRLSGFWKALAGPVNRFHKKMISKFDECWIPDFASHRLSGDLSRVNWSNVKFIGPLTTLTKVASERRYEVLAIVSGPEPQRTKFSEILSLQLKQSGSRYLIVHGRPDRKDAMPSGEVNFLTRDELSSAISEAEVVIARSGYSTIMDLAAVGSSAIFVPTPGQTEQIYLAEQLERARIAFYQTQSNFKLDVALRECRRYNGFDSEGRNGTDLLDKAIESLFASAR